MKVLHLTRDFPPRSHGGLSSAVSGWVRAHRTRGGQAAVISFDAYRPRGGGQARLTHERGELDVLRVEGQPSMDALHPFARDLGADMLHLHDPLLREAACSLRHALACPLVVSVHVLHRALVELRGLDAPTQSARAEAEALRETSVLTAPCPSALARLRADYPFARDVPAHVLPLAIEPVGEPRLDRPRPATVLFAGRFADVKGIGDFLQAATLVAERMPEVRFELAGGLPASPRSERRFVRRHVQGAVEPLAPRLRWLGWCDADALTAAYRRAHLLVAPSWSETFGQCAFEALRHGTPVITSDVGAYADYLVDGRECLKVPACDVKALAEAMQALLDDEARRLKLAEHAAGSVTRFAPEHVGCALAEIYARASRTPAAHGV